MGWLAKHLDFHDRPAYDIQLRGHEFQTPDPIALLTKKGEALEKVKTSAFHPFGKTAPEGATVPGTVKANGTILRMNPDGSDLEVYA